MRAVRQLMAPTPIGAGCVRCPWCARVWDGGTVGAEMHEPSCPVPTARAQVEAALTALDREREMARQSRDAYALARGAFAEAVDSLTRVREMLEDLQSDLGAPSS